MGNTWIRSTFFQTKIPEVWVIVMPSSLTPGVMILMPNGGRSPVFARNSWRETRWFFFCGRIPWDPEFWVLSFVTWETNKKYILKMMVFPKRISEISGVHFSGSMIIFRGVRCNVFFLWGIMWISSVWVVFIEVDDFDFVVVCDET